MISLTVAPDIDPALGLVASAGLTGLLTTNPILLSIGHFTINCDHPAVPEGTIPILTLIYQVFAPLITLGSAKYTSYALVSTPAVTHFLVKIFQAPDDVPLPTLAPVSKSIHVLLVASAHSPDGQLYAGLLRYIFHLICTLPVVPSKEIILLVPVANPSVDT